MADMDMQTPDLQSILATLASFAPPAQQSRTATPSAAGHDETRDESAKSATSPAQARIEDPRLRPQGRLTASTKPMIDPSTITTWQDGLRCVTKIAAQNASFAASIKKVGGNTFIYGGESVLTRIQMIDNQRQNEMRWYAERQALKQSQGSRERASAQALEILKGLSNGGGAETANGGNSVDVDKELATFDRKIYAAQVQMDTAMTAELKGLGVPFFGTDSSFVVGESDGQDSANVTSNRPKHSPLVTEKQLMDLRRRLVEHLEALYRD